MTTVPVAEPDPNALYVLAPQRADQAGCPSPYAVRFAHIIPTTGSCAFGAFRDGGTRKTVGVTLSWPMGMRVRAPLAGRLLRARPWSRDRVTGETNYILYLRTHRYAFGFGCIPFDSWRPAGDIVQGMDLAFARGRGRLHVSMWELPEEIEDDELLELPKVWHTKGAVPQYLVDPTAFLMDAAGRAPVVL